MLLTCPTCRSGLEVPDGTTAQVRCPTCRTIFAPTDGVAPLPPPPRPTARPRDEDDRPRRPRRRDEDDRDEDDRPRKRRRDDEDDEDDRPRRRRRRSEADEEEKLRKEEARRDREKRRRERDAKLSPEERRIQRGQFARGMWGCKLISISFALYGFSFLSILMFMVLATIAIPLPGLLMVAGVLGLLNWVLGGVGTGLCLAGRPAPGHWGFGIAAAVAVVAHGIVLIATITRASDQASVMGIDAEGMAVWSNLPTQLNTLTLYLCAIVYPDELNWMHGLGALAIFCGVLEVIRLMLVLLLVADQAWAAGDAETGHRCTRAAGVGSFGPGIMAAAMLGLFVLLVETGGMDRPIGLILKWVMLMGVHAVLAGLIVPGALAAREAADACELPFETQKSTLDP
jgi:LSD1 subclass zinc finger protein